MIFLMLFICFVASIALTPIVIKFALKADITDKPDHRKVHLKKMPSMGGLAIYISFMIGLIILRPHSYYTFPLILGSLIIVFTGIVDDIKGLSPKLKLVGQLAAALIVVLAGDIQVSFINLPFGAQLHLHWLSIPLTILWIIGITNAINLIDGLDGLAAGVSSIVLLTITGLAISMGNIFVASIAALSLGSTLGFLVFNFNPAKIFMGDTGSLFLGFLISVISVLGFKNVTLFSLVVPVIILGVPISDTFFAIIRRLVNKRPLSAPDKSHLHHCLLNLGYTHRETVLLIYGISGFFAVTAIVFSKSTLWGSLIIILGLLLVIELIVEIVGLISKNYRPILNIYDRLAGVKKPLR